MKKLVQIILLAVFLCKINPVQAQDITISGTVTNGESSRMVLYKLFGGQQFPLDTATVDHNDFFSFSVLKPSKGMYRITLMQEKALDLIVNGENIKLNFDVQSPHKTIKIEESSENSIYQQYLTEIAVLNDSIDLCTAEGERLFGEDKQKNYKKLEALVKKISLLQNKKNEIAIDYSKKHETKFVAKIIKADAVPSFSDYLKNEKNPAFNNETEFLKYHYLDFVDFSDSAMLNTPVIFERCGEYVRLFSDPPSVKTYTLIIDLLMGKASSNKAVQDYITEILLSSFDSPTWEDVYVYIVDHYYLSNTCIGNHADTSVVEKSTAIKKLKPGNPAPDFSFVDEKGVSYVLSESKSKYTLIFFWASWCEFCEGAIPELKKIYSENHNKGMEVISISVDTVKSEWITSLKKNATTWYETCDYKGFNSPLVKAYNIVRTPNIFLLDKNKIIVGHYYNAAALRKKLEEISWE